MAAWYGNRKRAGGDRGAAAIFAVLKHHHLSRRQSELGGSFFVDFGMRLPLDDVFARQDKLKSRRESKPAEDVFDKPPAAARRDRLGDMGRFKRRKQPL